jgi:cyclase
VQRIIIIPVLLLKGQGLYKTVKFKDPKYLGDPINAVKIFNDKEVDELCFLDITATNEGKEPNYKAISEIASECFMPLSYGGGISKFEHARILFSIGIEKIILSSSIHTNPKLVEELSAHYGAQSVVVCIDVKKNIFGKYEVYSHSGKRNTGKDPLKLALEVQKLGAGELIVNSIDRDGTMSGYDIELISNIANKLEIPVVACGGASCLNDFTKVVNEGKANAVAAGSLFVFHGKHKAVLISYPTSKQLKELTLSLDA